MSTPLKKNTLRQKQRAIDAAFIHHMSNPHLGSLQVMDVNDERQCVLVVDHVAAKNEFEKVIKKGMDILIECKHCNSVPCVLHKDGLYDSLMEIGSSMEDEGYEPDKIRFCFVSVGCQVYIWIPWQRCEKGASTLRCW